MSAAWFLWMKCAATAFFLYIENEKLVVRPRSFSGLFEENGRVNLRIAENCNLFVKYLELPTST